VLTIFTIPKAFRGHIGVIQTNAIKSWTRLRPSCEVILFGDDEGTAEIAAELGILHIPNVERNEYGTPLLNSIFSVAQDIASHQLMCYVNADIILMSDFLVAIRQIQKPSFLLSGRRWNIDLKKPLDFGSPDWEEQLRAHLAEAGKLRRSSGFDYFVFPRSTSYDMPPFAVGRGSWDNWLPYKARTLKIPLIDATEAITVVHQNHDYSHIPTRETGAWKGPEAKRNRELSGRIDYGFTFDYVTWILTRKGMKRALSMRHLYFQMRAIPVLYPNLYFLLNLFKIAERILIPVRSILRLNLENE